MKKLICKPTNKWIAILIGLLIAISVSSKGQVSEHTFYTEAATRLTAPSQEKTIDFQNQQP